MALTPTPSPKDKQANAEQDALLREVDDAVRQDSYQNAARKYGIPIAAVLVLGLASFGGYLWWDSSRENDREAYSEEFVRALDRAEAGDGAAANTLLDSLDGEGSDGARAAAEMMRAAIALREGDNADAAELYQGVIDDSSVPQEMRDAALIRLVAARFDELEPDEVIERLSRLAQPGNPWFGSAAEMTAFAHLRADRRAEAGRLLAQISQDENVPESLRSRTRQMAGLLGEDAITDVDTLLREQGVDPENAAADEGGAPAAAQAQ